jgi:kynurenine formamidase
MRMIDLSVTIESGLPSDPPFMIPEIEYWDHERGAENMLSFFPGATRADLPAGLGWAIDFLKLTTHSGTHLDAPRHYHPTAEGRPAKGIDAVPLEWCFGDGVVVDFIDKPDGYLVNEADMAAAFAKINHVLKPLEIVLVRSGAAPFWGTADYLLKGCGMGREATLWLLNQGVKVVGTDAWSWDRPLPFIAGDFARNHNAAVIWEGHFAGIEREYCHMEKMTNLDQLPPFGFKVACFPVKIKDGSAGWTRPVAMLP